MNMQSLGLERLFKGYFIFYLPLRILFARSIPYRVLRKRLQQTLLKVASENHIQNFLSIKNINLFKLLVYVYSGDNFRW
jgi:hypothetical protein